MFDKIKRFYNLHIYTAQQVYNFMVKGVITEEQYREIVGQ